MAAKSLLVALADLRRLENKIFVTENLLTRAFVHLLSNDVDIFQGYLKKLGIRYDPMLTVCDQVAIGKHIPDMQISGPGLFALQENKIDSPEGYGQRPHYLDILSKSQAKHKLFVYVEPRKTKVARTSAHWKGIRQKLLTWDEIADLVDSSPRVAGKQRWLREELLDFLKEKKMTSPPPLNMRKLIPAWRVLDQQEGSLQRIFEEAKKELDAKLNKNRGESPKYKVTVGDDERSLSIKKIMRGKLKKPMQDGWVWVWCGIYQHERTLYLTLEIGWIRNSYGPRISRFRKAARKKQFEHGEYVHEGYVCECYEVSETLQKVVGNSPSFRNQLRGVLRWISSQAVKLPSLLRSLERDLRK